jgi:type IV pilus assembly protein PilC
MLFAYTARNAQGETVEGTLEAADRFVVAKDLRERGQVPITVKEIVPKNKVAVGFTNFFARVKLHEKIVFTHNLSGMLAAGLPLFRALEVQKKQNKNPMLGKVIEGLLVTINQGGTLSDGLSKFPDVFPPLVVSMVRAGEESGNLSGALKEIGDNLDKTYKLNRKIKGALMYPSVVLSAIVVIGALMLVFVVPTLTKIFKDFGTELPGSTRLIINISDAVSGHPIFFLDCIIVFVAGIFYLLRSKRMKRTNDRVMLSLPAVKNIVQEINTARTARTLSSLLSAGVEMTRALAITKDVVQNTFYKEALDRASIALQKGETLSSVFKTELELFPIMVGEMVAVGEETGALTPMLGDIATYYEEEVDTKTKNLSTIVEPVLMVIIGAAVGFFAVSMISPMYGLVSTLST